MSGDICAMSRQGVARDFLHQKIHNKRDYHEFLAGLMITAVNHEFSSYWHECDTLRTLLKFPNFCSWKLLQWETY